MSKKNQRDQRPLWKKLAGVLVLVLLVAACVFIGTGCGQAGDPGEDESGRGPQNGSGTGETVSVEEDGQYDSRDEVALYIHRYGHLPDNYITKDEARSLGWKGGGLAGRAKGKCIGGDRFGNREKKLPSDHAIRYYECDIDTMGAKERGAKRIVYSDEGDVYYSEDHYRTFTKLYDKDGAV